jgi:hypothetical protein
MLVLIGEETKKILCLLEFMALAFLSKEELEELLENNKKK